MTRFRASVTGALLLLVALLTANAPPVWADEGMATWYGRPYHGRGMANGQVFDMYDPTTTACNRYPLGTWLHVTNLANGKSVTVQVRDTGGFSHALDLSYAAFASIADPSRMQIHVQYDVVSGPDAAPTPPPPTEQPAPPPAPPAEAEPAATPEPPGAEAGPLPIPDSGRYVVQPGDTLGSIASAYALTPLDLAAWNGLDDPDHVTAGQELVLVPGAGPAAAAPATDDSAAVAAPAEGSGATVYTVEAGDVLWQIAERNGVTTAALLAANGLDPDATIQPGQQLVIPAPDDAPAAAPVAAASATDTADAGPSTYTVQPGDTLAGIAEQFGTTADALLALNGIADADLIQPGQELRIR